MPPRTPSAENHFAKKTLGYGYGEYPPPLNGKSAKLLRKTYPKRDKNDVLVLDKVKNGQKRPYDRTKRAKTV